MFSKTTNLATPSLALPYSALEINPTITPPPSHLHLYIPPISSEKKMHEREEGQRPRRVEVARRIAEGRRSKTGEYFYFCPVERSRGGKPLSESCSTLTKVVPGGQTCRRSQRRRRDPLLFFLFCRF